MYPDHHIFVITDKGLAALTNNEIPSSVLTSILRLVDGKLTLKVFSVLLNEYGDVQPYFKELHNAGFISQLISESEPTTLKIAPSAYVESVTPNLIGTDTKYQLNIPFKAELIRSIVYDYLKLNNPRIIPSVMAMLAVLFSKQDFIDHLEMYSRVIAEDKVNASGHICVLRGLLGLEIMTNSCKPDAFSNFMQSWLRDYDSKVH